MPKGVYERSPVPIEERFWRFVDKDGPVPDFAPELGSCWVWMGSRYTSGYGTIGAGKGRLIGAHRWSYSNANGEIAPGLYIDHLCRVKTCVRPSHLEAVTVRENALRGVRGRLLTHCSKGHAFDEANTFHGKRGDHTRRYCRICRRDRGVARRRKAALSNG